MRNLITIAAATGLAAGGALGLLAPTFAAAEPRVPAPRVDVVTSVDVLGHERMYVTVRLSGTVRRLDTAAVTLSEGTATAPSRTTGVVTARPGTMLVVTFDVPPAGTPLTLNLPGGSHLPLTALS